MTTAAPARTSSLYSPWPKQAYAFDLIWRERVEQLLFGGSAGGAKSHWVRMLASYLAVLWPGSRVGIFRRTDAELQANHVSKWLEEVDPFVPGGRFFQQKMEYHWPSPAWCWCPKGEPCVHSSVTAFRHVDDNRGARKHQGAEFAAELIDEATHFRGPDIDFLYTRVRADADSRNAHDVTGPDGQTHRYPGWPGWLKLQALTANPGDVGEQYMLENYIDPEGGMGWRAEDDTPRAIVDGPHPLLHPELGQPVWEESIRDPLTGEWRYLEVDMRTGRVWTVEVTLPDGRKVTVRRAFVPSRLADNPSLDPDEYAASLAVGSKENLRRLLEGDWSYSEDRVFKMLDRKTHMVDVRRIWGQDRAGNANPPPYEVLRGIGLDHGTAKPTAVVWVALDDEGFFVAYREYYEPGSVSKHIREVRQLMEWDGHPEIRPQADPQMWRLNQNSRHSDEAISVATLYAYGGDPPEDPAERRLALEHGIELKQSRIGDQAALTELEAMLETEEERLFPSWHQRAGQPGAPLLFIAEQCPAGWRELTTLKRPGMEADGMFGEGIKNGQPDHFFDALKRIAGPMRAASHVQRVRRRAGGPAVTIGYAAAGR